MARAPQALVGALAALLLTCSPDPTGATAGSELLAGAASVVVTLPADTPLGGYGGFPRRAWVPDLLGRWPDAFWFRPAAGVHDPIRVRTLLLESAGTRVLWLATDLVGIERSLLAEARRRLARAGLHYSALIVSASHTHSGPGAYARSSIFSLLAVDRESPRVRDSLLGAIQESARLAEGRKRAAAAGTGKTEVPGIARSRVGMPLDQELGVLKVTGADGRPLAVVWNYAVHGTALPPRNLLLSADLMGEAGARIEQALGVPALFVNGAAGDVSPRRRGWAGVSQAGTALAAGALAVWQHIAPEPQPRLAVVVQSATLSAPALSVRNCLGGWVPPAMRVSLGSMIGASGELIALAVGRTAWVTIPGELESKLGLEVKAAGRRDFEEVFVAGLSNDYLAYFLTPEQYRRPDYIACGSLYGERGGEIMRDAAIAALRRLAGSLRPAINPAR